MVTHDQLPTELNGFAVLHAEPHNNCATVMVETDFDIVVATWWPELGPRWSWGHYFDHDDRKLAETDFDQTAKRNAKR